VTTLFRTYAKFRHGRLADPFVQGFLPLVRAGNAKFMAPPRKRLLVPYYLVADELALLDAVREGARAMADSLEDAPSFFLRDFIDLMTWVGVRQAHVYESDAYLLHVDATASPQRSLSFAETTWTELERILSLVPELSIVASAESVREVGPLSKRIEESFWTLACDFYNGYPLVMSPEAMELVYLPQSRSFGQKLLEAGETSVALEEPGWFWHDFPDRSWADAVRKLPSADAIAFEAGMRERVRAALAGSSFNSTTDSLDAERLRASALAMVDLTLPEPRRSVPSLPNADRARHSGG
jgi:hypothetical protein